jgi:hypothetical protein
VDPVTVFITVDNESMILEVVMVGNRNVPLSSASLNPKKVDVVFNIDMTFQCENYCNNYQYITGQHISFTVQKRGWGRFILESCDGGYSKTYWSITNI